MQIYYRGPYNEFTYPLNSEATEAIVFVQKTPALPIKDIAQEVTTEQAEDLLTRRGHNFRAVNPEDADKLFADLKMKKREARAERAAARVVTDTGDDTPPPVSPSLSVLEKSEHPDPAPASSGDALLEAMKNSPATVSPKPIR
jgi:hypothetical protein